MSKPVKQVKIDVSVNDEIKTAVKKLARQERRTMSDWIKGLILKELNERGIEL